MSFSASKRVHFSTDLARSNSKPLSCKKLIETSENSQPSNSSTSSVSSTSSTASTNSNENNQITVAIRVRPMNPKELSLGYENALLISETNDEISLLDRTNKELKFTCDFVITDQKSNPSLNLKGDELGDSQQQYVYESIGKPLLNKSFDGYNVSIFAYGQTGSGKTYSMIGSDRQQGLIPRFFNDLFEHKYRRDQILSSQTHIEISYYEIYNEKIYDLLRSPSPPQTAKPGTPSTTTAAGRNLQIRENPHTGPYIVDLLTLSANSAQDAKLWLDIGNKRRATACTNMNQKSSRSHSVFQINLTQMLEHANPKLQNSSTNTQIKEQKLLQLVTSRINLVDLAGSERINTALGPSAGVPSSSTSNRFKESTCINKSLLTLGKIICLLSDRQSGSVSGSNSMTSGSYLPYRESVLTWLLKESLGGNAKTAMLATVNPSKCYLDETICTLRYAAKTACIKNTAHLNRNFKQKYINEYGQEKEMNIIVGPLLAMNNNEHILKKNELEMTIKQMELEWKAKLEEAERLKQKEISDLEKSLIVLYENETRSQNCCLINLNEDPSLSEKLIYLLKSTNQEDTSIGSDKCKVNIHLIGALIAPIHARIYGKKGTETDLYLEHLDANYKTYLNGEVCNLKEEYKLNHADRIIFGGSHFFRFNNPASMKSSKANFNDSTTDIHGFKDYQFAKNEIERKQNELIQMRVNEELNKFKRDGDMKINELKQKYEKNLESVKNDLEREKSARLADLEKIKSESNKKIKQIFNKKILIETKLNECENEVVETRKEIDKHEKELIDTDKYEDLINNSGNKSNDACMFRTPMNNRLKINRFYSDKIKNSVNKIKSIEQDEIIQTHASSNSLFAITLCVTEANKICSMLCLEYELKRYEIIDLNSTQDSDTSSVSQISVNSCSFSQKNYIQAISCTDKRQNLITLWNLSVFEHKLNMLREAYDRFCEEGQDGSDIAKNKSIFSCDSDDEWQNLDEFIQNEETFLTKIVDNALGRNKSCKRRISVSDSSVSSSMNISKSNEDIDNTQFIKKQCFTSMNLEALDTKDELDNRFKTPQLSFTPGLNRSHLSILSKKKKLDIISTNSKSSTCNFYLACRDALVANLDDDLEDDLSQSEDEEIENQTESVEEENKSNETMNDFMKEFDSIKTHDDAHLKLYLNFASYINRIISHRKSGEISSKTDQDDLMSSSNDCFDTNNDQPVYCMKILMTYSKISQYKINEWLLFDLNRNNNSNFYINQAQYIYYKINKKLKHLKESLSTFFQSLEENSDESLKDQHSKLTDILLSLINLHGQYVLLTSSNTLLNKNNFINSVVNSRLIHEYTRGVEKQFDKYLTTKQDSFILDNNPNHQLINSSLIDYIQKLKTYLDQCNIKKVLDKVDPNENILNQDSLLDYNNYMFQTHFRLSNAFKLIKSTWNKKNVAQILNLLYNVLTDSLSINTINYTDDILLKENLVDSDNTKKINEIFMNSFNNIKASFKRLYLAQSNKNLVIN